MLFCLFLLRVLQQMLVRWKLYISRSSSNCILWSSENLCEKVTGKISFLKKPGNKNFRRKVTIFWSTRTKYHFEIKSWVLDFWNFFSKIMWGLPIKSQEIRWKGKIALKKKCTKKSPKSWENEIKTETFS